MSLRKYQHVAAVFTVAVLASACANKSSVQSSPGPTNIKTTENSTTPVADPPRKVKSRDGKYDGEVSGKPAPGSKFARLAIGMQSTEVQNILDRAPDRSHAFESGKRWIPFYFGNDARRTHVLYKGEGCLIFTGGNVWGGGGGDLVGITFDPSGVCYEP